MSTFENAIEEKIRRLSKFSLEEVFLYLVDTGSIYSEIATRRQIGEEMRKVETPSGYREPFEHEILKDRLYSDLIEALRNKDFDSFERLYMNNQKDLVNVIYSGYFYHI